MTLHTKNQYLLILFIICLFTSCKDSGKVPAESPIKDSATSGPGGTSDEKIVYVDIDTLLTKSDLYNAKKSELENQSKVAEKALAGKIQAFQTRAGRFQQEVAAIQQKAASIAPVELKKMEEKFTQQQGNLAKEEEALYSQRENAARDLEKKLMESQKDLQKNIDDYLSRLAKEKGYDLILIKGSSGAVMYGDKRLDITLEVVKQLNEEYTKNKK